MSRTHNLQAPAAYAFCRAIAIIVIAGVLGLSAALAATTAADDKSAPATPAVVAKPAAPRIDIEVNPKGADADTDEPGTSGKHHHGTSVHIQSGDRDFDSFANAVQTAPWVVGLVFLVVGSIFLTPLILLIGIIWYKLRKTRMQNDAMLKLAERGIVPSAQIAEAVATGQPLEGNAATATANGGFQQAVATRRRAVWSDLRKGVILTMVGLSFVFYSMADSGSANWLGLLLVFLGVGYVALWWLEDRHLQQRNTPSGPSGGNS
jgi:hypothetical protein